MDLSIKEIRRSQEGFTLVELAVVMIIIGLLIGGILKGQELITNARVTSTGAQLEAMGAAYNGFRDKFNAIPGDMLTANTKIGSCAAIAACANGDGDSVIDVVIGAAAGNNEGVFFFGQLLAADFITGMDGTNNGGAASFGVTNPTAPIGGGFLVGDGKAGAPTGFTQATVSSRPYVVVNGTTGAVGAGTGVLSPQQAANIDRRLDDGVPTTGGLVGQTSAANVDCSGAATTEYGSNVNNVCVVGYRL